MKRLVICILLHFSFFASSQSYQELISKWENKTDSYFYSNKDSVYYYHEKIYKLSIANQDPIRAIDNLNSLCGSAGYFFDTDKIWATVNIIDGLVKNHKNSLDSLPDKGNYQKNYLNYNKGNYFNKLEDFEKAQLYFEAIEKNITKNPQYFKNQDDVGFLGTAYSFIAKINAVQHHFKVADNYYQKNIRLSEEYMPNDIDYLNKIFNLYANSLFRQKKYEEAKNLWRKTFLYTANNYSKDNQNSLTSTGLLLSKVYGELNNLDSATYFLNKTKSFGIPEHFKHRHLTTSGDISSLKGESELAEKSLLDALKVAPKGNKPLIYQKLGSLSTSLKEYSKALIYYQKGLQDLTSDLSLEGTLENPPPEKVLQKQELLRILGQKSEALNARMTNESYQASVVAIETAILTIDLLKPKFKNDKDKTFLIENAFPAIESGIEALYQLHKSTKDPIHLKKIFRFFEKSKSVVLISALLTSKATQFSKIPAELIEEERNLKSKILVLEKKISLSKEQSKPQKDLLFDAKNKYRYLIEDIEKNHPSYFNLKYNNTTVELEQFQKTLKKETLALSYFYGNKAIYVLGVSNDTVKLHKIDLHIKFSKKITSIYKKLQNSKSSVDSLALISYDVFSEIVTPLEGNRAYKNLLVIPDGLLNYLPFGALNTSKEDILYLVEKTTISYSNSATLNQQLNQKNNTNEKVLALAPTFQGDNVIPGITRDALLPLPNNKKEAALILNHFKGDRLLGDQASLQNFTSSLSDYGIIHMATHGNLEDKNPEYSYLAFTPKSGQDYLLYVKDIYNLELNANLVTLSACETGVGELKRGEGFLSLARGFFYSGASSIVSTLWKVNDASTATLMDSFYENLSAGDSKDLALQEAKKSFLYANRQNGLSHPYYWSGFIVSGNTTQLTAPDYLAWIGIAIILSLIAGFIFFRSRKN